MGDVYNELEVWGADACEARDIARDEHVSIDEAERRQAQRKRKRQWTEVWTD